MRDPMVFEKVVMPSGMRVFLEQADTGQVAITVIVHVGYAHDPPNRRGLSHVAEHLMTGATRGYRRRGYGDMTLWLASPRRRTDMDAGVTEETHTAFSSTSLAGHEDFQLRYMAHVLQRPMLTADRLAEEIEAVKRERSHYYGTEDKSHTALQRTNVALFGKHVLAKRLPYPDDDELNRIKLKDVRAFHERCYVPSNMTMIIHGQFNRRRMLRLIERLFPGRPDGMTPPILPPVPLITPKPHQIYERYLTKRPDEPVAMTWTWNLPPGQGWKLNMLAAALDTLITDRVRRRNRRTKTVVTYEAGCEAFHCPHYDQLHVEAEDVLVKRVPDLRRIIRSILRWPPEKMLPVLARAKELLMFREEQWDTDLDTLMEQAIDDVVTFGAPVSIDQCLAEIGAVTPSEAYALLGEAISPNNGLIVISSS
ncbi:MAG: insulinase family protein [Patescibacteria group bacterium]|nr:insulinase family protein [Patescibacteria group bacterium]